MELTTEQSCLVFQECSSCFRRSFARIQLNPFLGSRGKQRAAGGRCDNPTVEQFCVNTVSLRVQGSAALDPVRGNCKSRKRICTSVDVSEPLTKRARRSKKSMSV